MEAVRGVFLLICQRDLLVTCVLFVHLSMLTHDTILSHQQARLRRSTRPWTWPMARRRLPLRSYVRTCYPHHPTPSSSWSDCRLHFVTTQISIQNKCAAPPLPQRSAMNPIPPHQPLVCMRCSWARWLLDSTCACVMWWGGWSCLFHARGHSVLWSFPPLHRLPWHNRTPTHHHFRAPPAPIPISLDKLVPSLSHQD